MEVRVVHNSFGSWTSPHSTHRSWAREGRSGSKVMHRSDGAWSFIVGHKPAFARSKSRSNQITVNDSNFMVWATLSSYPRGSPSSARAGEGLARSRVRTFLPLPLSLNFGDPVRMGTPVPILPVISGPSRGPLENKHKILRL